MKHNRFKLNINPKIIGLVFTTIILSIPQYTKAQAFDLGKALLDNTLGRLFSNTLGAFKEILLKILNESVEPLLTNVLSYTNFFSDGVNAGWTIVRNFANLFFALALLIIAIATVLQVSALDNYTAKRMLPNFIFVALFINFSKAIVGFFIDISQIIMITFYNAFGPDLANSIAKASKFSEASAESNTDVGTLNLVVIVIIIVLIATLLWTALLMAVRIVTLWVIIMISPVAFLGMLIPALKSITDDWKNKFQEALVTGPTLMFLLYLAVTVMNSGLSGNLQTTGGDNLINNGNLINFVFVIILLFLANGIAMKAGQAAPPMLQKAVGIGTTLATFGVGKYVGAGGYGTGTMIKTGIKGGDKIAGGATSIVGKNTAYESKKRDWKEKQKQGGFGSIAQGLSTEGKKQQLEDFEKKKAQELAADGDKIDQKENARYKAIYNRSLAEQSKELNDEGKDILELRTQLHEAIKEDNLALQQATMLQITKMGQLGTLSEFNPNASAEENTFFADIAKNNATEGAMTDALVSRIETNNAGQSYANSSIARNFRANLKTVGQDKKGQASFVSDIRDPGTAATNPNALSDKIIGSGLVEGIAEINKNPNAFRQRERDPSGTGFAVDAKGKPVFTPNDTQILKFIDAQKSIDTLKDHRTWNRLNDASTTEFLQILNAAPRNTNRDAAIQGLTN